jgi:hypothetical protein
MKFYLSGTNITFSTLLSNALYPFLIVKPIIYTYVYLHIQLNSSYSDARYPDRQLLSESAWPFATYPCIVFVLTCAVVVLTCFVMCVCVCVRGGTVFNVWVFC